MVGVVVATITATVSKVIGFLLDKFMNELGKFIDVQSTARALETELREGKELLEDVELNQIRQRHSELEKTYDEFMDLNYHVEDIVDEIFVKTEKLPSELTNTDLPLLGTIPRLIEDLQKNVTDTVSRLKKLIKDINWGNIETFEPSFPNDLVGRDEDVEKIIKNLLECPSENNNNNNNNKNKGTCIVGMDGIGKSSLVNAIKTRTEITEEFHVLEGPIENGALSVDERFLAKLREQGTTKKMLIILDDLLKLDVKSWDVFSSRVKTAVSEDRTRFLITTRDPRISKWSFTIRHDLSSLSDECCKQVMMETARSNNVELEEHIAAALAKKCQGLPFIAKVVGLQLAADETNKDTFIGKDLWDWLVFRDEIFPKLCSSSIGMQWDAKNTFAFISLFPRNHCFENDTLVQLWVGAGFIKQRDTSSSSLEEIGEPYIDELLRRSLLQHRYTPTARKQRIGLHSFNHQLAQAVASKTCVRLHEEGDLGECALGSLYQNTRHLSISCESIDLTKWKKKEVPERLSTLLLFNFHDQTIPPKLFKKMKLLRVLVLTKTSVKNLPDSIKELKHLRFLDVSHTRIFCLPETLSQLRGLLILKFHNPKFSRLPKDLHKLTNLVYLDWDVQNIRTLPTPCNIGKLARLQNLPLFKVGEQEGQSIKELQNMNNLQGSFFIECLENVKNEEEAKCAKLAHKSSLKAIKFEWTTSIRKSIAKPKDVLSALKPPKNIKELTITNYEDNQFPLWLNDQFSLLEKIHLNKCNKCTVLPPLRQPALKVLKLTGLTNLTAIDAELCRSLEELELEHMPKLKELKISDANAMLKLRKLKLTRCGEVLCLPALQNLTSLENLEISRCKALKALPQLPTSLKYLEIQSCSTELMKQYQEWREAKTKCGD